MAMRISSFTPATPMLGNPHAAAAAASERPRNSRRGSGCPALELGFMSVIGFKGEFAGVDTSPVVQVLPQSAGGPQTRMSGREGHRSVTTEIR